MFRRLAADFTIHFGEIHNIQIVQWPENIKLQVRTSNFSNSLIIHQVKTKKIISVKEVWIPGLN